MKPEGAEEASKPMHLARLAIAHFDGLTEEDRGQLAEQARNGDKAAQEELEAATTAGLERARDMLSDGESMDVLELGIALGISGTNTVEAQRLAKHAVRVRGGDLVIGLEEQINQWTERPTLGSWF